MRIAPLPCTRWILTAAVAVLATAGQAETAGDKNLANKAPLPELIVPVFSQGLKVTIDTRAAPECQAWAERAREMVELWHPVVSAYLDAPLPSPPTEIRLVFKDMPGVAHTGGSEITISSGWVKSHPEDLGMVLHELVHVIQRYPSTESSKGTGWLVEGIADYIRFWLAEPSGQPRQLNRAKDNYRQGYRTAAVFLAWVERKYQVPVIRDANRALRKGDYQDKLFEAKTGKTLDALWAEFINSLAPKQG